MSRALFLSLSEADVIARCEAAKVGISALEKLPGGGVRLVCMSSEGAAVMNRRLKVNLMPDSARRTPFRPAFARH